MSGEKLIGLAVAAARYCGVQMEIVLLVFEIKLRYNKTKLCIEQGPYSSLAIEICRMISKYICVMLLTACVSLSAACGKEGTIYETAASSETESGSEYGDSSISESAPEEEDPEPQAIFVYVCGAVEKPGVYELPPGSRVYEAIAAAGGMTENADEKRLNQAEILEDGQQVTVWTRRKRRQFPWRERRKPAAEK